MKELDSMPIHRNASKVCLKTGSNSSIGSKDTIGEDDDDVASVLSEVDIENIGKDGPYYHMIRRILYPFALTGAPIVYCLRRPDKPFTYLSRHGLLNIYSIIMGILVHSICLFWLYRVFYHIVAVGQLSDQLWDEIFTFIYSLVGVWALDMGWIYRKQLRQLIRGLDRTPHLDQTVLMHYKYFHWKYQLKLTFLTFFVISLLILCVVYIVVLIFMAINTRHKPRPILTDPMFTFVTLYSLYVVLFVMVLYIALCWIMKFRFEHLNFYVQTLTKRQVKPELKHLEIVKQWYKENLDNVDKIDQIFNGFIFAYFVFLFFGIIVEIGDLLALFNNNANNTDKSQVISTLIVITLMLFSMFYTIKQTSDVTDQSMNTGKYLFEYVLATDPSDRSQLYTNEMQLIASGLLSNSANLTLFGLVNLNRDFMAQAVVFLYTIAILFNELMFVAKEDNLHIRNVTHILANNIDI
ncbi:uncharacterized protein LOC128951424 [Oppia nitens]|uniref:uncharacterized protein LOC128951424 n=1 Tax=Oppia nitens TaxID=1686743 RepID=UPI0023DABA17|nr:uncharacterized protein LOC128951424 [Oppia nitens]